MSNRAFFKRLFQFLGLFIFGIILAVGCTTSRPDASSSSQNTANTLNVYNWSTYIDPEVVAQFEKEFNVKVNYDTYDSSEALYAKLQPGNPGYDVAFPADYMVKILIDEQLLEPLNLSQIPNVKNIEPKFLNPPYDPNNQYSVPYQWATLGLGYNLKKTGEEITSWEALFDPKYKGRVAWLDDMRHTMGAVLLYLGYDPNTTNKEEIQKARDFVIQHKDNITAFVPDTGQQLLSQGEVDITMEYSGDIFQIMEENPDIRYVIPKEGTIIGMDNMVIPKGAPHPELATQFINFVLIPENSAKISNFINYGSPNKTAIDEKLIKEENLKNPAIYPPPEVFAKLQYLKDVGEATVVYDEAWTEAKLGVGK